MGLLDALNSDEGMQAMGLLAAAGPSATPMSFGQRLFGAMQQDQSRRTEAEDRKMKQLFMQVQIKDMLAQAKLRESQATKSGGLQELLQGIMGGQDAPSQYGLAGRGVNIGGVQEPMRPKPAGLAGATPEQLLALKAAGVDARELWHDAQRGLELKPGSFYQKGDRREYIGDPTKSIGMEGGRVSLIPGALEAQAALAGATKDAEARAGGMYDLVSGYGPNDKGEMVPGFVGTKTGIAERFNQPQQAPQQGPRYEPVPTDPAKVDPRVAEAAAMDLREWTKQLTMKKLPGQQSRQAPGGVVQTGPGLAEQGRAAAAGKYDEASQTDLANRKKLMFDAGENAGTRITNLRLMGNLLAKHDGGKLSETGLDVAQLANSAGFKIDPQLGNKEAARALQSQLTLDAVGGSLGPGVSNSDVKVMQQMVPTLSLSAEGRQKQIAIQVMLEQRKQQVAQFARNYETKYGRLDNGFFDQLNAWKEQNRLFPGGK